MQGHDDRDRVIRELTRTIREMEHDVANALGVPLNVLELLREHPHLSEFERDRIDRALARLTALAAEMRARQAQVRRLVAAEDRPI